LSPEVANRREKMARLTITPRHNGKVKILDLSGDFEGDRDGSYFFAALKAATSPVVLNLAGIRSIDNEGIGAVLSGCRSFITDTGGWVVLAEMGSGMGDLGRDVLGRTLKAYPSEGEAVAFLQQTCR
jgi:hypothetical protein